MIEALYVHIPFCRAKCHYCDFNSVSGGTVELQERYIDAVKKEILLRRKQGLSIQLKSVFFGGGTPTCLAGGLLEHLLDFIRNTFPFAPEVEITVEANPGTVTKENLEQLRLKGVNRISFGVQSFNDRFLKQLGRIHSTQAALDSLESAREAGFTNINFDLMYGLPGQTLKDWEETLLKVLELNLEHISLYQLKIEEGTPFGQLSEKGLIEDFDDQLALDMYKMGHKYLSRTGFIHYEISNYARPGFECRHNQVYWRCQPYLGVGAGAHSYLPPERIENVGDIAAYLEMVENNRFPQLASEKLTTTMAMSEAMFMGLRLLEGVNLEDFYRRFGQDARIVFKEAIAKCQKKGLIRIDNDYLKLTPQGVFLGNLVFEEFLLDN
ncbi:MAG: radical SAM family heme chaperone HemW [Clostridia bacterium]|nr:radical SAM family heme chaperone HemW [Clostridia bacterium]